MNVFFVQILNHIMILKTEIIQIFSIIEIAVFN